MEKLSIFATTLLILLVISNAAIHQTTIFTNEEESEYGQSQQGQRCRQQIQSQQFRQYEQCQCEGLKKIVHRQQLREMKQRARELPQMCGSGQICRDVGALLWF
ncbi:hypothetical protein VitviT2T_029792 [Vitis vinifera]|uniref:Bifunctional inhibitor/plant lipid transfer protein/seed storage helical domain-containing protein n=1 Tax=Vitis vinifera TaxID=29760 RepID=A0ABY9DXH1_VITVI|nr:hypothetical protein VitviT2T_029792 [Vitis vinifera]